MDKKSYSKLYYKFKLGERAAMRDAVDRFAQENPERFTELQEQALRELNEPPKPRIVTRYTSRLRFDADMFIRQHHTQSYYIHTKDCWGDTHLYFERLDGDTAEDTLTRRHSKFTERREEVTKVEKCECPLCQNLN